jgi:hypothetical protein
MKPRLLMIPIAVGALFATSGARAGDDDRFASLEGAWIADVVIVACDTGAPTPAPPFQALVAFHDGGTLSEASGPSVRRTPSFGTWTRLGRRTYRAVSVLLTYDVNGFASGSQEIRRTIRLARDGASFTADTQTVGRDVNGVVLFRGCARGTARRVE